MVETKLTPQLIVVDRDGEESRYTINQETTVIGREESCDVVLNYKRISRRHAVIQFDGKAARIQDLASTNGTMLNDNLLTPEPKRLQDGDVITISPVTITFVSSKQ
jgi:pSer/pThr/pTyr-binding forkhead associated (FHA) protein